MKKSLPWKHLFASIVLFCILSLHSHVVNAQVVNTTHAGAGPYATIQAAINNGATVAGDVIVVSAGVYTENVDVNKSLTLRGPNAGIAGNGVRGGEAVVDGNLTGAGFVINNVNDVTIDGFKVINGADGFNCGISFGNGSNSNLKILNNIITLNHIGIGGFPGASCQIKGNLIGNNNVDGPIPAATGVGIYLESSTALTVENNEISNQTSNAVLFAATSPVAHTNLQFTSNHVHDNAANVYCVSVATGVFNQNTLDQLGATCLSFAGACTNISVNNNFLIGDTRGLRIDDQGYGYGDNANITVHDNSFTGGFAGGYAIGNLSGYTGAVDATCNWFGTTNSAAIALMISGSVNYIPYLTAGADSDGDLPGFQPAPGTCNGGLPVHNITQSTNYPTIQSAINAANPNDVIVADAGTYNESVNINKTVNLRGAQADVCAPTRAGAESIISCPRGIGVNASNVTINGFTIQDEDGATFGNSGPGFGYAVFMAPGNNGTHLINNIIKNNTSGTGLTNSGAAPAQVLISCNWYASNNNPGPVSGEAIYTDEFVSQGVVSNVLIDNNKFSGQDDAGVAFSTSTAANASTGITISNNDFDGNGRATFLYNLVSSSFSNNLVHNSTFTSSGEVRPFGGVHDLQVNNNFFIGSAANVHAIRVTDDGGGQTNSNVTAFENSFVGYSNANTAIEIVSGYTGGPLTATCNWWNTTDGAVIASQISGSVIYAPWLTNGTDNSPAMGFQPVPNSCTGGVPRLTATINGVTVTSNANGLMDDNGAFTVCNTPNNFTVNAFSDVNGVMPASKVRAWQELVTLNNVTVPFCNNCSAPVTAFPGATGSVALVNPNMPGTLVIRFRAFFDVNGDNMINPGEPVDDWVKYTVTVNPFPTFSFDVTPGGHVANVNNGVADPGESATVSVCNGSMYSVSNLIHSTPANRYIVTVMASGGGLLFDGSPAGNADISAAQFNGAQGSHTITLVNPNVGGQVVQTITPYYDANGNGSFNAGECQGDPIKITYIGKPRPVCSITGPNGPVCPNSVNTYSAPAGMTTYAWTITGNGTISGASNAQTVVVNAGANCNSPFTLTLTITSPNGCSSTCQKTVNVLDNTPPTFTAPANQTIMSSSTCSYTLPVANPLLITDEADNCGGAITITSSDAVAQCGNNTVVTRTWKATDACGNSTTHDQVFTVTDNNTPYIIYATSEAKFGEDNLINGDVGVTAANGKAEFKKGDVLDPYHVYAKNITVQMPAMVNNKHFVPATGGPNPPFQMYVAVPLTGNYNQTTNGTVPAGNYKELTIKKGVTATVNGSNYGKINIEENANVTFTSNSINMEELNVKKGKDPGTTNVYFTTCTAVRVKDRVTIEENSRVNVGGPKVTFYLGDSKKDEENFSVKGDNSQVTLNIMIPNGKLKVSGGNSNAIMTGWFIIEKLESDGKNVTWNKYGCGPLAKGPAITQTETKNVPAEELVDAFKVNVYPNPSSSDFKIQVLSPNSEPVMVRIFDISGKTLQVISNVAKNSFITVGGQLRSGAYYAEVQQGASRQTVKLVKAE